jgi:hypothetical protein
MAIISKTLLRASLLEKYERTREAMFFETPM